MKNIFYNRMKALPGLITRLYVKTPLFPLLLALVCVVVSCSDDEQQDDTEAVEDDINKGEDGGIETDQDAGDQLGEDGITLSWKVSVHRGIALWFRRRPILPVKAAFVLGPARHVQGVHSSPALWARSILRAN
jgi:hypothetical protein